MELEFGKRNVMKCVFVFHVPNHEKKENGLKIVKRCSMTPFMTWGKMIWRFRKGSHKIKANRSLQNSICVNAS